VYGFNDYLINCIILYNMHIGIGILRIVKLLRWCMCMLLSSPFLFEVRVKTHNVSIISKLIIFFFRPLHEAVENGDVHLVRLLLSYGADPHLATYSGQSPLSLATDKQTRMLLEHHVNDVQGYGSASVWNFDDSTLTRKYFIVY